MIWEMTAAKKKKEDIKWQNWQTRPNKHVNHNAILYSSPLNVQITYMWHMRENLLFTLIGFTEMLLRHKIKVQSTFTGV